MKKIFYLVIAAVFFSCNLSQSPKAEVVTTNAWTAAYALAAGAEDIRVLTPYEMIHPSEYELRPGDISHLNNAKTVIYAGYEIMMSEIKTGLKIPDEKMLQIQTSYNLQEIEEAVMLIARRLGTEEKARENLAAIQQAMFEARELLMEEGFNKQSAVVHFFQQSFVAEMGLETLAVFGPAPPEARQILEISQTRAQLIIDNAHNPAGGALRETIPNASYVSLLNFPGLYDTRTLVDVINYNARQLKPLL
jgi:ABC-type Zn2+ transport system substrate-binding protein/surface adhesin